jgi:hypothetical protein
MCGAPRTAEEKEDKKKESDEREEKKEEDKEEKDEKTEYEEEKDGREEKEEEKDLYASEPRRLFSNMSDSDHSDSDSDSDETFLLPFLADPVPNASPLPLPPSMRDANLSLAFSPASALIPIFASSSAPAPVMAPAPDYSSAYPAFASAFAAAPAFDDDDGSQDFYEASALAFSAYTAAHAPSPASALVGSPPFPPGAPAPSPSPSPAPAPVPRSNSGDYHRTPASITIAPTVAELQKWVENYEKENKLTLHAEQHRLLEMALCHRKSVFCTGSAGVDTPLNMCLTRIPLIRHLCDHGRYVKM